jgi:hypothetical protein
MGKLSAVLLAGTIRPSPLREALDIPMLCLPVGVEGSLLDAWHRVLDEVGAAADVRVVVNSERDVEPVAVAAESSPRIGRAAGAMGIMAEPAAWRGTAGVLRDVTDDLAGDDRVIVVEARCLPPASLRPLLEGLGRADLGVVGVCGVDSPAGVSVFRRRALEMVAAVGYYDLKEQLLPSLHGSGLRVTTAAMGPRVHRIRDRDRYLAAVATSLGAAGRGQPAQRRAADATVASSALLDGFCIIEPGVDVRGGAVVHESVILAGATIERNAVVSRSVIGPGTTVAAGHRAVRSVLSDADAAAPTAVRVAPRHAAPPARRGAA